MSMEEAHPEAAALLAAAGWKPHDGWNVYTRDTLVMGFQPDGLAFHVKNWAAIREGHPQWTADTPDTAEEAAQWLADRYKAPVVETNALSLDSLEFRIEDEIDGLLRTHLAPVSEEGESLQDESNGETGEARVLEDVAGDGSGAPQSDLDASDEVLGAELSGLGEGSDFTDADFTIEDLGGPDETLELPAPDPEDFAPEEIVQTEDQSGAFIFGDNLHQMRTAAIGLVVQAALIRLPAPTDYGKLSELRNFAMGVSENRWPDDPAKRDELDAMEAIERRRRQIEAARDEKVAFLASEETTREQIEAFDPEAGWPE